APVATWVAYCLIDTPIQNLGGTRRTRQYFTEALETGASTQFLVGRVTNIPGFYFSARIGTADEPYGVLVVKQTPEALSRQFSDPQHQLMVSDAQGVVLMSNHHADVMGRIVTPNLPKVSDQTFQSLYRTIPKVLNWSMKTMSVKDKTVTWVQRGAESFMALSHPLQYGQLTLWTLIPMRGEANLIAAWMGGLLLTWLSGLGFIGWRQQRLQRAWALSHAQRELEDLANALPLTVFRYHQPASGAGYFSFIGGGLEDRLGITAEQLQDDPQWAWRQARTPELLPPTKAVEFAIQHAGRHLWIQCESLATPDGEGGTTYNGYWTDITERKEVSARSQAVFEYAPFCFIFFDDQLKITRCNPAALSIFGAKSERDLIGLQPNLPPLSPPVSGATPDVANKLDVILKSIQAGQTIRFDWIHQRLDGQTFDADVVAIPFEHNGQRQVCAIIQDISIRKQTEAANLLAQQAAEAAAQAKSRFLANMSHEIRTPMNAVLGMTHLALLDNRLPDKARHYIDKAHRSASNLLQILNDVLDVSKIESGKLELEQTEFQLETVVSHMADILGVKAEEKGLELLFTAPPDMPTALIGDPTRLGQILINLGNNAIKFTQQGEIVIGCDVQRLNAQEVTLHFWIKDTGIGMSTDQIDRLFQPFTQGDNSTTRQYGGTGLGLTISKQLTELMHGQIWVDSAPGRGSTFHFTAQFGLQATGNTPRALLATELRDKRVLLVDDNPAAREVLGEMARRLGLQVDVASSGEQALAMMEHAHRARQAHHILLTDWKMPGMDGITFARKALQLPPEHRPCVLLVTAFAREEAIKASQGIGLAGIITKPVTPSTLFDTLAHTLGHQVVSAPAPGNTPAIIEHARRRLAGARVLLVEDQVLNQELACDLLQRAGIEVVTANHGEEALQKLEQDGPFDGVLMDCQMPVMDGYTATQRIRAQAQWATLPIIAMTASAMAADRDRVLQSGMNDHITKPLDLHDMFNIMAKWIVPSHPMPIDVPLTPAPAPLPISAALDTVDGLSRCMDNLDLYRRLIRGFAKTQADFGEQFRHAQEDVDQASQLVHTLKGLAGNIGAKDLLRTSHDLEQALHQGQAFDSSLQSTLNELDRVLADITRILQNDVPSQDQVEALVHDPLLQPYWQRLAALVDDNEAQATDVLLDIFVGWPAVKTHPTVKQLEKALTQYDFDQAAALLATLRTPEVVAKRA
ncbi:MAG: response regulator, partial [Aquabacterium sp.]